MKDIDYVLLSWAGAALCMVAAILTPDFLVNRKRLSSAPIGEATALLLFLSFFLFFLPLMAWDASAAGGTLAHHMSHANVDLAISSLLQRSPIPLDSTPLRVGYFVIGFVWSIIYFYLYSRDLGRQYVVVREQWLTEVGATSLNELTPELRSRFKDEVIGATKASMIYPGDFPLNPFQQKRLIVSHILLWPITLLWYLSFDAISQIFRTIAFHLRGVLVRYWTSAMPELHADLAECANVSERLRALAKRYECQPD